jgi:hypothetical protein
MEIDGDPARKSDDDPAVGSDPSPDWRIPYFDCLIREVLLMNKIEVRWLARHTKSFVVIKGELYKKSHTKLL